MLCYTPYCVIYIVIGHRIEQLARADLEVRGA